MDEQSRYGVTVSKAIGGAVRRNRAKRRMRAVFQQIELGPGWDLILVARPGLDEAPWSELIEAVSNLLNKAGVIGQPG